MKRARILVDVQCMVNDRIVATETISGETAELLYGHTCASKVFNVSQIEGKWIYTCVQCRSELS